MNRVSGKVALVTGAASGLGNAIALLLAAEGARVMATDVDEVGGRSVAMEFEGEGGEILFAKQNVTIESEWKEIVRMTTERFGKLDVLVNCAGVFLRSRIAETTLEQWRWVMSINLDGGFPRYQVRRRDDEEVGRRLFHKLVCCWGSRRHSEHIRLFCE